MKFPWVTPGQQVVCVDDDWSGSDLVSLGGHDLPYRLPMLNEVLTIRDVEVGDGTCFGGPIGNVYLSFDEIELKQVVPDASALVRFNAEHFRPLFDKTIEADASTFRKIADSAPARQREDA